MTTDISHVLFQCTGNLARSMMAKANLDLIGAGKFTANSAGSMPAPSPRPNTFDFRTKLSCIAGLALFSSWDTAAGRAVTATWSPSTCPPDLPTR